MDILGYIFAAIAGILGIIAFKNYSTKQDNSKQDALREEQDLAKQALTELNTAIDGLKDRVVKQEEKKTEEEIQQTWADLLKKD